MLRKLITPCLLLLISYQVNSQTFTANKERFVKELDKYLSDFDPQTTRDFMKEFEPFVLTNQLVEKHFTKMVETCNLMVTKNLKPFPEVYNYVFSVYSFDKNKQPEASYDAWHATVDKMLDSRTTAKFKEFITVSSGLFSKRMIYSSTNYECYFRGGTYLFNYTNAGPEIQFTNGTLSCVILNGDKNTQKKAPYEDSAVIVNTSGVYDPISEKWEGKGGKVTWEKVGLPANETWADLNTYKFSLKMKSYNCDTVTLHTPYFKEPLLGSFSERTMNFTREIDKKFPLFTSFNKDLLIKEIIPQVDYVGGFALKGSVFVGVGTLDDLAEMHFYRNKQLFATVKSQEFSIDEKGLTASNAAICIKLGLKDSITHSGLDVRFTKSKDELEFSRGKTGAAQSPFSDSYHKLDLYVDRILWNRKETRLVYTWSEGIALEQRSAHFESKNFFDERLYDQLQGLSQLHPLVALSAYAYKYDEYEMTEGKAASALGRTIEQAKPLMLQLAIDGFISYDLNRSKVTILPKTDNFIQSKSRKKDYDNIDFICDLRPKAIQDVSQEEINSTPSLKSLQAKYTEENKLRSHYTEFGEVDLSSLDFKLTGVDQVILSDAQKTAVFPAESKVIIQNNRNFYFNGWINSGKWSVRVKDGTYDYDANKINIPYSDYASMRINPLQEADGTKPIQVQSSIAGLQGEILVDDPSNRAGIKKQKPFSEYPRLISKKETKVFYNSPGIQRGAYDSTRFYFAIAPFEFDSLDNFYEKNVIFKGELVSAGIFPKFAQDLKIMPDYSFGFSTNAPAGGYDFYGTGAKYDNKIVLSNNGLQGAGKIDYLTATAISKAFTFLPDSTTGVGQFNNKPRETGIQMPDVESEQAFLIYSPKNKVLSARSMQEPLTFFNKEAKLRGEAFVRPTGMTGRGAFDFKTALVGSDLFKFQRWDIDADSSFFQLIDKDKTSEDAGIAFKTDNVSAHVSFKDRKGVFKSNEGESIVEFPINEYICKMDVFTWFMDKEEIEMSKAKNSDINIESDLDLAGTNFVSINKDQDSLRFLSGKARFVLKTKTIFCEEVEFIDVADARIFPDSMNVVIRKKAKMDPLKNSRIVANYITKYHQILNAETNITARRAYTAVGDYPYFDLDSTRTLLKMDKVYLDTSYQTIAVGNIAQEKSFKLSPQFEYYGTITMKASTPKLSFEGATKIIHNCDAFSKNWMSFSAEIDPKNIQIPVGDKITSLDGKSLSAGIVWHFSNDLDSTQMYPTFLSEMTSPSDVKVITASGWLQYNQASKEFEISSREKLLNRGSVGNYISLHTQSCSMNGDGKVNVGMDYGDMTVDAVGIVNYNQTTKETTMNLTARISTPMDKGIFKKIADKILLTPELKPTNLGFTTLESAIATWNSQKEADKFKSDFTLKGEVAKIPGCDDFTFVLSNIKLKSMPGSFEEKGLITSQTEADLVSIYGTPILKSVPIQVAFYKPPIADMYRMGLNLDLPGNTYFFNYDVKKKNGLMKIYTTDPDFTQSMTEMKPEKKKIKNFEYDITTNSSLVSMFKRLFE